MDVPFGGNVNFKLVLQKYKQTVFYYVKLETGRKASVRPCILLQNPSMASAEFIMVKDFKEDWSLETYSHGASWKNLFLDHDEAKKVAREANKMLFSFRRIPYLDHSKIKEHFSDLTKTEALIDKLLGGFENYGGIDFCDVHAGGIQVRLHHNQIEGYTYGNQITISYDFSNIEEVPWLVAKEFVRVDKPELISKELQFLKDGEKYGFD